MGKRAVISNIVLGVVTHTRFYIYWLVTTKLSSEPAGIGKSQLDIMSFKLRAALWLNSQAEAAVQLLHQITNKTKITGI
tara:strand:+ start:54 stop:290 length:237 start_codon:yes stop_codon:yes gene_type:complete